MELNPGRFVREVRREVAQVTWPTRRETIISTVMVFIMVTIASIFFLVVDQIFAALVRFVLQLG